MSELEVFDVFAKNSRQAAAFGRQALYGQGWVGLRVISVEELPPHPRHQPGGLNQYLLAIEGVRRIPDHPGDDHDHGYWQLCIDWWDVKATLLKGVSVRTRVLGIDYSDGQRHEMTAGSVGIIVKRYSPYVWVSFPQVPGRSFMYAHPDVEPLPKTEAA